MNNNNKYSNYKIVWFPEKLRSFKHGTVTPPIYVRIKPTNRCCHSCFYCVYNSTFSHMHETMKHRDELSTNMIINLLDNLKIMNVKAVTYSGGGEPLMHPDIYNIFEKTLEYNINLSMITNGQLLNEKISDLLAVKAKWIRISADYCNMEMFKKHRSGTETMYKNLIMNIERFAKHPNRTCDLGVNFIISKDNFNFTYDAAQLFKELGVDYIRFSPMWTPDFGSYHRPISDMVKYKLSQSRKELENNKFKIYDSYKIIDTNVDVRTYNKCYIMQMIPVIGADGNVYTCHNKAYTDVGRIGSIFDQSFRSLWESKRTLDIFNQFDPKKNCKHQCSNDAKNIIIEDLINCEGDNFV